MQSFSGKVISAKTPQTVGVAVTYSYQHPKYKKIVKRTTKLLVHNELNDVKEGDVVKIQKTKPYSRNKHFKVIEVTK